MNIRQLLLGAMLMLGVQLSTSTLNSQNLSVQFGPVVTVTKPPFSLRLATTEQPRIGSVTLVYDDSSISTPFTYTLGTPVFLTLQTSRTMSGPGFTLELFGFQSPLSFSSHGVFAFTTIQTTLLNSAFDGTISEYLGDTSFPTKHSTDLISAVADNTTVNFSAHLLSDGGSFDNLRLVDQFRFIFTSGTNSEVYISAIPEPLAVALLLASIACLVSVRRFRRN